MPDVIEKLVEILRKTRYEYRRYIAMKDYEKRMAKTDEECCAIDDSIVGEIPFCADHLIANGVTIPIRCKDCKHWLKDVPGCTDAIGRCRFGNYMVGASGYCVYGERKDND